jgi:tetratricopeptide (TPR) repeat protein
MKAAGATAAVLLSIAAGVSVVGAGQAPHRTHAPVVSIPLELLQRPAPLRKGIGTAREQVTTKSATARALYEQGLAYLHSFVWIEAARSFHSALRQDPNLAMAHLGLSFAFGGLGSSAGAREALGRARTMSSGTTERERLRIDLRARQLETIEKADPAAALAYRSEVDRAVARYPNDVELLIMRAQAEDSASAASPMESGASAVAFYKRAAAAAPGEFAAHHYLIHAYENSGRIGEALAEAETYVKLAPEVAHAHHMLAHGLRRSGRIKEAIAAFRRADDLDAAYLKTEGVSSQYEWHFHHNQIFLAAAYRYLGQISAARERLQRIFDLGAPLLAEELGKRDWPALLLAAGSSSEALAAANRLIAHASPLLRAAGHLAAAHVQMASGQARAGGNSADAALKELRAAGPPANALAADLRLVQGEFLLRSGDRETGRQMIRAGVQQLRALPGPDAWGQTLFQLEAIGQAARDVQDWALAAELADAMRQHDPLYAGTSYALGLVAEQRGDRTTALQQFDEAVRRWSDADATYRYRADAQRRLAAVRGQEP